MNEANSDRESFMVDTFDSVSIPEDVDVISPSEATMTEYHAVESSIRGLKVEQEVWRDELEKVRNENHQLKLKFDELSRLMQSRGREWSLLSLENSTLLAKVKQSEDNAKAMGAEMERLREENRSLNRSSAKLRSQNHELQQEIKQQREELLALQRIETDSSYDLIAQQVPKKVLEEQIVIMTKHISKSRVAMGNMEKKLTSRISSKMKAINKQKEGLSDLVESYKLMKMKNTRDMEMQGETICKLREACEESEREKREFRGRVEKLEHEKTCADKEVENLREVVQVLEVHLKLLNQKVKITKSEHKEKEENSHRRIRELQNKCRKLEQYCEGLREEIQFRDIELEQIKGITEIGLTNLAESFEKLEVEFEDKIRYIDAQMSKFYQGFQRLKEVVASKLDIEFERRELLIRIMYQDEIISMLKEESGTFTKKLAEKEEEERRLSLMARDYEMKVQELTAQARKGGTKDEGMAKDDDDDDDDDDDKREIVRQLCILMEHYRENCNTFLRKLSTNIRHIKPFI